MALLFESRRRDRKDRKIQRRKDRKPEVKDVLEDHASDTDIPVEMQSELSDNYPAMMLLANDIFPHANSREDLEDLVMKHPKFAGKPKEQQTYGSIMTVITVIKILMTLYDLWKKYKASQA